VHQYADDEGPEPRYHHDESRPSDGPATEAQQKQRSVRCHSGKAHGPAWLVHRVAQRVGAAKLPGRPDLGAEHVASRNLHTLKPLVGLDAAVRGHGEHRQDQAQPGQLGLGVVGITLRLPSQDAWRR